MQLPPGPSPRALSHWLIAAVLIATSSGCALEPEVGQPQADRCTNEDSDPDVEISFANDVFPLLTRSSGGCMTCHNPDSSTPLGVTIGGLNLTSYESLRNGGARTASDIVVVGSPCSSALYLKLTSAPFGSQMPANGPPFWTPSELQTLKDWIVEGAHNN
ncbi:MAG: hypothetical protein AUK47_16195 [Deltaproteobacteria bacterium CG2_30_63_29]|nr:MAG: hypothetical protein AUK47_16195 [Deltaproteobacteria bacterium CG2_30_63_29]PIW02283.1 MAG: hypothetical protein COW42_02280 [Deltaproteobacteria bacterium CG17_big_fil_post_rev_8_21_14_2_50_63_7]PJB48292.1 MAG: hypothetical protein CO108_02585 [Deltaproteobacteria bacterium CG_4_9_14_3_um_filter_63_12]